MGAAQKAEGRPGALAGGTKSPLLERPWLLTMLLATGLCAAYLIGALVKWGEVADRSLYANLGMIPIGLAATILALNASTIETDRRSQWAWRFVGAGLACFWAGDVLFFFYQNVLVISPFPSMADVCYLAYYPLVLAGLLCYPGRPASRLSKAAAYLGCFMVVAVGSVVILYVFLLPTLQSSRDDLLTYWLSVGYPLGDVLLLAGIAKVLLRRVSGSPLSISLLTVGLLVGLVADVVYGYQGIQGSLQSGGFSDAAFMVSWALFAWAGYAQIGRTADLPVDGRGIVLADER